MGQRRGWLEMTHGSFNPEILFIVAVAVVYKMQEVFEKLHSEAFQQ